MKIMNEIQKNSENMTQSISTMGIIIHGKQGSGKTLMAINLALDWEGRIYSNFKIFKHGKLLNRKLNSANDVQNIRFSYTPGIIIIDEAGINANSKDSRSQQSRILQEILFLVRKKNCSLIWISQRFESIDINARVLSEMIIEMHSLGGKIPKFIATRQRQKGNKLERLSQFKIDTIGMMKMQGITYNTLEASKFDKLD